MGDVAVKVATMVSDDMLMTGLRIAMIMLDPVPKIFPTVNEEAVIVNRIGVVAGHKQIAVHSVYTATIIGHDLTNFLPVVQFTNHGFQTGFHYIIPLLLFN
jgi:hypothetical protein